MKTTIYTTPPVAEKVLVPLMSGFAHYGWGLFLVTQNQLNATSFIIITLLSTVAFFLTNIHVAKYLKRQREEAIRKSVRVILKDYTDVLDRNPQLRQVFNSNLPMIDADGQKYGTTSPASVISTTRERFINEYTIEINAD
jgi:hypothetical protein